MYKKIITLVAVVTVMLGVVAYGQSVVAIDKKAKDGFNQGIEDTGGQDATEIKEIISNIINLLLFIAGIIAVIVIVVSGLRFIGSDGNPQAADKARNNIVYALVGLIIAVLSFALVKFILGNI